MSLREFLPGVFLVFITNNERAPNGTQKNTENEAKQNKSGQNTTVYQISSGFNDPNFLLFCLVIGEGLGYRG